MNKIITHSRFCFSLFGSSVYFFTDIATKHSFAHLFILQLMLKVKLFKHNPFNITLLN